MSKKKRKMQLLVGCTVAIIGGEFRSRSGTVRKLVGSPHDKGIAQSIFVDISGVEGTVEIPQHHVKVTKMPEGPWRAKEAYVPREGPKTPVANDEHAKRKTPPKTSAEKPKASGEKKKRSRRKRKPGEVSGIEIPPSPGRYAGKRPQK